MIFIQTQSKIIEMARLDHGKVLIARRPRGGDFHGK